MHDRAGLAVHKMRSTHHASAKRFADRLVSEAYAEHRSSSREVTNEFDADTSFMRRAGAGRDYDPLRPHRFDFFHCDLIITANFHLRAQFAEILDQVISEGVVVIENENQFCRLLISSLHQRAAAASRWPLTSDVSPTNGPPSSPTVVLTVERAAAHPLYCSRHSNAPRR